MCMTLTFFSKGVLWTFGKKIFASNSQNGFLEVPLFESVNICLETPMRKNQHNYRKQPYTFKKARKRIETLFSQLCDQFMISPRDSFGEGTTPNHSQGSPKESFPKDPMDSFPKESFGLEDAFGMDKTRVLAKITAMTTVQFINKMHFNRNINNIKIQIT